MPCTPTLLPFCVCVLACHAQTQFPKSGVELALAWRCSEAMPLLDAGMREATYAVDAKRAIAMAGVPCCLPLNHPAQ